MRVKAEIGALLARLEASDCRFNRNGKWYKGTEASVFLTHKFAALDAHGGAASTERFIELAASKSGTSGQAYLVQCGAAPPAPSNGWLNAQLSSLRGARDDGR